METKIQGWAAVVIAVVVIGVRLMTIGSSDDPRLHQTIKAELANDLGNNLGKAMAAQDGAFSEQDMQRLVELADRNAIMVLSTKVSKPLLSLGSSDKVIVQVRYSLPEQATQQEYWRFSHGMLSGWRVLSRHSSALSYYLNFM